MKFLPSAVQKLSPEQTHRQTDGQTDRQMDRQTDRHTDRQTQLKLLPTAYADGKNNQQGNNYIFTLNNMSLRSEVTHHYYWENDCKGS